jgi:hypothetical protein
MIRRVVLIIRERERARLIKTIRHQESLVELVIKIIIRLTIIT